MDVDLPIPLYVKMKKLWEDKLLGVEAPVGEEEDPEIVEWQEGEEQNYAAVALDAVVTAASTGYSRPDGPVERNLLLPSELRESAPGNADTRFLFESDDQVQQITLDLGRVVSPTKLGAELSIKEDDHPVMESFVIHVSVDGDNYAEWSSLALPGENPQAVNLLPASDSYEGPPEIRFVRFSFGCNHKSGSAVVQLFAFGREKVKKQRQDLFPALCSDGRHLVFLHAATVKANSATEKEAVLQAFVLEESERKEGFQLLSQTDFQWGIVDESQLFACSFACNSDKVQVVHRKNFSNSVSQEEKDVEVNVRTFELSTGRQISFSEVTFSKVHY